MADNSLIKRNIETMIAKGARKQEIDTYIGSEGVTAEQLRADRSAWQRASGAVESAYEGVRGTVVGEHDPKYADVESFVGQGLGIDMLSDMAKAKMVAISDEAYGDIVRKKLGKRLIGKKTDANGYQIITYKDLQGDERTTYINKPGLDWQDVDRGISATIPYAIGASVGGRLARGLGGGMLARTGAQATGAGAASVAADLEAGQMGSEQGVSLPQALLAAGGAGLFEGLSGPISTLWRKIFKRGGVTPDGRLTDEARRQAQKAGLDPNDMDERLARQFADDIGIAASPEEAASKARTSEFGIPSTVGQRTKDPAALGLEEEGRRGLLGSKAQSIQGEFDQTQGLAITGAVEDTVGGRLAPQAAGREPATTGQNIGGGLRDRRGELDEIESGIWDSLGPMYPTDEGFELLTPALTGQVMKAGIRPDEKLTPAAHKMVTMLDDYRSGKPLTEPYAVLGEDTAQITIDDMRRRLLAHYKAAEPRSPDAAASKAIYDGFNIWIDDLAETAAIQGDIGAASQLSSARAFTRNLRALFEPRDKRGKLTAGGRILRDVFENETNPDGVVTALFGAGGPTAQVSKGTVDAAIQMKKIFRGKAPEVWDDIRLAYWTKITTDKQGKVLSGKRLTNNINTAIGHQNAVMVQLYTPEERALMKRLASAIEDTTYVPPNPSGTSYELQRMQQRGKSSALKTLAQVQQKRELFSKNNIIAARLWQLIARKLPFDPMGLKEQTGAGIAARATSQKVTPKPAPSLAPIGGSAGAQYAN